MYSISALRYSPEINEPLQSALKPTGKGQIISIVIEVLVGGALCGVELYFLFNHGMAASQVGRLAHSAGYLCFIAPGLVLSDYLIGSVIKGIKNHKALKQEKQPEPNVKSENLDPLPSIVNNEIPAQPETLPNEELKANDKSQISKPENKTETEKELKDKQIESIRKQKEELTVQLNALISKQNETDQNMKINAKVQRDRSEFIRDIEEHAINVKKDIAKLENPTEREEFLDRSVILNANVPPEVKETARQTALNEAKDQKNTRIEKSKNQIENCKGEIELLKNEYIKLEKEYKSISDKINDIQTNLQSMDIELKKLTDSQQIVKGNS